MPQKRKFVKKSKFVKKTKEDRVQNKRIARVEKAIKAEVRQHYLMYDAKNAEQAGEALSFVEMKQGDTDGSRDSQNILVYNIRVRSRLIFTGAGGESTQTRCLIVLKKQANGSGIGNTELFNNLSLDTNNYRATPNHRGKTIYKILKDKTFNINPIADTTASPASGVSTHPQHMLDWSISFKKPIKVSYNGDAGTGADILTNNLFFVVYAQDNADYCQHSTTMRTIYTP